MSLVFQRPWTRQPQAPVRLNRGHPLARGLVALFDTRCAKELISGDYATNYLTAPRVAAPGGIAANFPASGSQIYTHRPAYAVTGDITIASVLDVRSYSNYSAIIAKQATSTTYAPYELRLGSVSGGADIDLLRAASSGYAERNSGASMPTGFSGAFVVTQTAVDTRFYYNGLQYINAAATSLTAADDGSSSVWIGRRSDGATQFDGRIYFVALWARELSGAEAYAFNRNPWQLFTPEPRKFFVPGAVAAGGTFFNPLSGRGGAAAQPLALH